MKVYIAGPMMGDENYNREAFFEAAKKLEKLGWDPVYTEVGPGGLIYDKYLKKSRDEIEECDAICLLEDWGSSRMALMEYAYANCRGLPEIWL